MKTKPFAIVSIFLGACVLLFPTLDGVCQSGPTLALDGVDDYASAPDSPSLDLGAADGEDFTIEAFFYVPHQSGDGLQTLIYKQGAYGLFVNFRTNALDDVLLRIWTGPVTYIAFGNPANLSVGWHHVAAVFDNEFATNSDRLAIYLDGDQLASFTATDFTPGIPNSTSALNLGSYLGVNPFDGWIDEVRLSDTVRYSGTSYSVPPSPLPVDGNTHSLWHFNELAGSTSFNDASGNANTLTGLNGAQTKNPNVTPIAKRAVIAWGDNYHNQTNVPPGLSNAVAIAGGRSHSVALKADGSVVAWGYNCCGQTSVPTALSNVVAIAAGGSHSLAIKADGTVAGWGSTSVPSNLSNVVAVAAGGLHSLALESGGTVVAWGDNSYGQATVPFGLNNIVAVSAGENHSLALRSNGTVVAWGDNSFGQRNVPAGLNNVVGVAAGGYHCVALKSDGTVIAWGYNDHGETNVPAGLSNIVAVAGGGYHSLALRADGTVAAWGWYSGVISPAASLSGIITVAGGGSHGLAIAALGPTVLSVNRHSPTNQITTADFVVYRVTFSDHVTNVSVGDFTLVDIGGTINGETITSVSASEGTNIDVTINAGTHSGDLRLDIVAPGATIADDDGTPLYATFRGGQVYTLTRPGVRGIL